MTILVGEVKPVIDYSIRKVCKQRYKNHPHGCPNWNNKATCPPKAPSFHKVFDQDHPFYVIVNAYPLGDHMRRMQEKHPQWTDRQLRNPLYWQGTARKLLKEGIQEFLQDHLTYIVVTCPEALGLMVTDTVSQLGVELHWPPMETAYQVALGGKPVKEIRTRFPDFVEKVSWGFESERQLKLEFAKLF